jgi:hypothetical protein
MRRVSAAEFADGVVERLGLFEVAQVTGVWDHDEVRIRDRLFELACDAERRARVPLAPDQQCRHGDARKQVALVGLAITDSAVLMLSWRTSAAIAARSGKNSAGGAPANSPGGVGSNSPAGAATTRL